LYSEGTPLDCLLGFQLSLGLEAGFEIIVVVVGYKAESVIDFVSRWFPSDRIRIVRNSLFSSHGTCESLACAIRSVQSMSLDSLVYIEGDLYFDEPTLAGIAQSNYNVITANTEIIRADTSVIFSIDEHDCLHYAYDVNHRSLSLDTSFKVLGNSGQAWKFASFNKLVEVVEELNARELEGTNLIPITRYFNSIDVSTIRFAVFKEWVNCNTVADYRLILKRLRKEA
jgi:choline kinase